MISSLEDLSFVVTGSARGIGLQIAKSASLAGARVVLSDVDRDECMLAVEEVRSLTGGEVFPVACDVTKEDEIAQLVEQAAVRFGGIDVLVNNAGVHERMLHQSYSFEDMPSEIFEEVLAVNLRSVWLCTRHALPYLKKSRSASVVNAGSTAGLVGYANSTAYGPSKGAVVILTKDLAVDLGRYGIRVNCYCPGAIDTRMVSEHLERQPDPNAALERQIATHLVHRLGRVTDVADLVCFLASPASGFITGEAIRIDGGSLAWRGTWDQLDGIDSHASEGDDT